MSNPNPSTVPDPFAYDVFLSYSPADAAWVRGELLTRLEEAGLRVCIDFRDFRIGAPKVTERERAILSSKRTLLILTPAYLADEWTEFEALLLQTLGPSNRDLRLVPLLKTECDLPLRLQAFTNVNFADPSLAPYVWRQLLTALGVPPPVEADATPTPEQWALIHPYPMPPHFTGRVAERRTLTNWLARDRQPLLIVRALGGFGKSALTWHWLLHDVDPRRWPHVLWWSFYEGDASFERFLRESLEYLQIDPLPRGGRQQVDALLTSLRRPDLLLILDGFERQLRAFAGLTAAYQGDEIPEPVDGRRGSLTPPQPSPIRGGSRSPVDKGTVPPPIRGRLGGGSTPPQPSPPEPVEGPRGSSHMVDENTVPPPWGRLGGGDPTRQCISPLAEYFLRAIATLPRIKGKVLLTTRLRPNVLESHGELLAGVSEYPLTQLQPDDAVALFRALGVRGNRGEIESACAPYGYHPLSLRLLAGWVLHDLRLPGDISAAQRLRLPGDISAAQRLRLHGDLIQRQHHVLDQAYRSLTPTRRTLLSRIACFRFGVEYGALQSLVIPPKVEEPPKLTWFDRLLRRRPQPKPPAVVNLDADLNDLLSRGLLQRDPRTGRFDLHPIVRHYAYDHLGRQDATDAHRLLIIYFQAVPAVARPQRLDDLQPVIELYHHTLAAGRYDEAFTLFRDRLNQAAYYQFGAYQLQIELLRLLFPDGEEQPPRLQDKRAQGWTLNELANAYSLNGQPRRAVPLFEQGNAIDEKQGDKPNLAIGLGNLAYMAQLPIGALEAAAANLRRRIALCREIENEFNEAAGHGELGRLLLYAGAWAAAEEALATALRLFEKGENGQGQGIVWAYRALGGLLMGRAGLLSPPPNLPLGGGTVASSTEPLLPPRLSTGSGTAGWDGDPLAAARRALELADEDAHTSYPVERDYVQAHWLLGAAHRQQGDQAAAESHLIEALTRCRAINLVEFEADILIDLARLRVDQGHSAEVQSLADEALAIAERCGHVLQAADTHLELAKLALARGARALARHHAGQARTYATCDGPPAWTYQVAYDEAGWLLAQVG